MKKLKTHKCKGKIKDALVAQGFKIIDINYRLNTHE
jgi:hypothetical protein